MGLFLAMEVLNRYESHLLNTAKQALDFVEETGTSNVGILLDAYHMNIEEADPAAAVMDAGDRLLLFHAAAQIEEEAGKEYDENRQIT